MASLFGKITEETPNFEVLKKTDAYEIRRYAPCIFATTHYSGGDGNGFSPIADYIFGKNKSQSNPDKSEKIAMTAPVLTKNDSSEQKKVMSFVMPSQYQTIDQLPKSINPEVKLKELPARTVASIRFSGAVNQDSDEVKMRVEGLKKTLTKDGITVEETSPWELARYNPPWTLPWYRTNEIYVNVKF